MIEPTGEMIEAAERGYGGNVEGDMIGAIKAVLAIVERDRCMEAKGHVFHPLAKYVESSVEDWDWKTDRHHYDVSCDDRPYCRIPEHHEEGVLP